MGNKLGIVWPVSKEVADCSKRLLDSIEESNPIVDIAIYPIYVDDNQDPVTFNISILKNRGIAQAIKDGCDVICCTDADYIWPTGLSEYLITCPEKSYIWHKRRDVSEGEADSRRWIQWLLKPTMNNCWGSCIVATANGWRSIGGWQEKSFGWGGDDDLVFARFNTRGFKRIDSDRFPLMHIAHAPRPFLAKGKRSVENMKLAGDTTDYLAKYLPSRWEKGLSVSITTCNRKTNRMDLLKRTMDSIKGLVKDIPYKLIVDDGSPDNLLAEIKREYPDWQVYHHAGGLSASWDYVYQNCKTEWNLHFEDDWVLTGEPIDLANLIQICNLENLKIMTFRFFPCPVVKSDYGKYRIHEYLGQQGPDPDLYDCHWKNYSGNPSLQHVPSLYECLPFDVRDPEGQMANTFLGRKFKMAHTYKGLVRHIGWGRSSFDKNNRPDHVRFKATNE